MRPIDNIPPNLGVPLLGQQQQQQQQLAAIQQAVNQLSMGIYSHAATCYVETRDAHQTIDPDKLQQLARDSMIAARAYFEGLGIARFEEKGANS